jgi:hypothetical protein
MKEENEDFPHPWPNEWLKLFTSKLIESPKCEQVISPDLCFAGAPYRLVNSTLGGQPTRLQILWGESPLPSIARFGRLVYPGRGEVTNRGMFGSKSHRC